MVKYGKEFKKNQISEYKRKYFDYKRLKQFIKTNLPSNEDEQNKENVIYNFVEILESEIKKVYTCYNQQENSINSLMNSLLYNRANYDNFSLKKFTEELIKIKKVAKSLEKLVNFSYYNLLAFRKILKKFDKKINCSITEGEIQKLIEDKSNGLLHVLKFRLVNEVIALIDDVINQISMRIQNKIYADEMSFSAPRESFSYLSSMLLDTFPQKEIELNSEVLEKFKSEMSITIEKTEEMFLKTQEIFSPWKNYLTFKVKLPEKNENSTNINSNNQTDFDFQPDLDVRTFRLLSKENYKNVILIFAFLFFISFSYAIAFPFRLSDVYHEKEEIETGFYIGNIILPLLGEFITVFIIPKCKHIKFKTLNILLSSIAICGNILFTFILYFYRKNDSLFKGKEFRLHYFLSFIGRFLLGLGSNFNLYRRYIISYGSKRKTDSFFFRINLINLLGYLIAFAIYGLITMFSLYSYPELILSLASSGMGVCFLIMNIFLFKDPFEKEFKLYEDDQVQSELGESLDLGDESISQFDISQGRISFTPKGRNSSKNEDSIGAFKDVNLIRQSIQTLAWREKSTNSFISKSFMLFFWMCFIISYSVQMNILLSIDLPFKFGFKMFNRSIKSTVLIIIFIVVIWLFMEIGIGMTFFILNLKDYIERIILIVAIGVLFIINIIINIFSFLNNCPFGAKGFLCFLTIEFFGGVFFSIITTSLSNKIIPSDFRLFRLRKGSVFQIAKIFGEIIAAFILVFLGDENLSYRVMLTFNTFLIFTFIIFFGLNYEQFKPNAISRLLADNAKARRDKIGF